MAKELFNSDFYTLPEQVQINKEEIKNLSDSSTTQTEQLQALTTKVDTNTANIATNTSNIATNTRNIATNTANIATNTRNIATNTSDITKLQDDISKIKPNAWEKRKFNIVGVDSGQFECTTYNPITDINVPVNAQKTFTDKDAYSVTESINSYSYSFSFNETTVGSVFTYAICADPSLTITDMLELDYISKNGIILQNISGSKDGTLDGCIIYINCKALTTEKIKIGDGYIEGISNTYDTSDSGIILSASVINYNYLRKSDASDIYLKKTDASNTYVTKQDYNNRFEKAILTLTEAGFNKIKTMVENEGTTITLIPTTDFTEQVPEIDPNNMKEIRLYVNYGVESIYSNIHLMPNITLDDYDNLQGTASYWYTGHAMLSLPTQDNGYFVIAYQKGVQLILRLIMHY